MAQGVMIASDCADWWDQQLKNYKKELDQYVVEHPDAFGIAVATVKASAADFAHAYFVDLIRLGEGTAQGGVKGILHDVLRVMNFIPEGKVLSSVKAVPKSLIGRGIQVAANLLKWRRVEGGLCTPIAVAQALERSGQMFAVGLSEIAATLGERLSVIARDGVTWEVTGQLLERLGVKFEKLVPGVGLRFEDVMRTAGQHDGPLLVSIGEMESRTVEGVSTTGTRERAHHRDRQNIERHQDHRSLWCFQESGGVIQVLQTARGKLLCAGC